MIICPNCKAEHPDDANFCDQCGEDLVIKCRSCGATARPTAKFCPKCRNRLNGNASEEKIFKDNVIAGDVNASTSTTIVTNNYGPSFADFDDAFCGECGEIIPGRLKIFNKCKDCGEYFCNKHLKNQICQSCEKERFLTPFVFEKRANNKYAIIRLKNIHEISVDIPSFVESIEDGAFEGSDLIQVTFHDGLVKIGNRAFANCKDMGDIRFPTSLCVIGAEAFYGCSNLSTEIRSGVRIGANAFHGTINDSRQQEAKRKAEEAKRQEEWATFTRTFEYEKIHGSNTYKITKVKDETVTSVTIPEFVSVIGDKAFLCSNLITITIPNSVTSIGDSAFWGCSSLTNITIPNSVTSIGCIAFLYCSKLTSITFEGTVAKWNAITKGSNWNCTVPATEVVCSDGTARLEDDIQARKPNTEDSVDLGNKYCDMGKECYDQKNYDQAVYYYQQAADLGNVRAWCSLGVCYYYGRGVNKDETQAVYWYTKAANQGYSAAQQNLGVCYHKGIGVQKDDVQSVYWYKKAAEQGRAAAQYNLGLSYARGEGVQKDDVQAVYWYKKAAEQGHVNAQFNLGLCYRKGEGVQKDDVQSVYWYKKAAEQGDVAAQQILGVCYTDGIGVNKDSTQAFYWFKQAAEQGFSLAQISLGTLYKNKDDIESAKYWYKKAADQGDSLASIYLKDLSSPAKKSVEASASTECEVWLTNIGHNVLYVIKTVRQITNLGLKEVKDLTNNCPSLIAKGVSIDRANEIKAMLENDGAKVEIKGGK